MTPLSVQIIGTSSVLPGHAVPSSEVFNAAYPHKDPEILFEKTGIRSRHWAPAGTNHVELGATALAKALQDAGLTADQLRRIVFVSCQGGPNRLPANANAIADAIGIKDSCDCFDLNNACTGFISAFDLMARTVATGLDPVAIVVAELWSPHLEPSNPRPYVVFGDAASAVILGRSSGDAVLGLWSRNQGALRTSVTMEHGYDVLGPPPVEFGSSARQIGREALDGLCTAVDEVLSQSGLRVEDIDWFLPHQPNGPLLQTMVGRLGISENKLVPIVHEVGSVSAASVPMSLDRLRRRGDLRPGQRVLLAATGSGLSYGAALYALGA